MLPRPVDSPIGSPMALKPPSTFISFLGISVQGATRAIPIPQPSGSSKPPLSRGSCRSTAATHLHRVILFIDRRASGGRALGPRRRRSLCCRVPHIPMAWTMCRRQCQLYSIQMWGCFLLDQKKDRGEEILSCDNCDCDTPLFCFLRPADHTFLSEFDMICLEPRFRSTSPILRFLSMSQYIPILDDPNPGSQQGGIDGNGIWWVERQEALESAGYMLRPLDFEDGQSIGVRVDGLSLIVLLLIESATVGDGRNSNFRRKASDVENQRRPHTNLKSTNFFHRSPLPPIPEIIAFAYSMSLSSPTIPKSLCNPCYVHLPTCSFDYMGSLSHSFPIHVK